MAQTSRLWSAIEKVSTVCIIGAAGLVVWTRLSATPATPKAFSVPKKPVPIDRAATIGSDQAPVGMIVYSDFQCPYCARFAKNIWPGLRDRYVTTGKVSVTFHHLPLPIHSRAIPAAQAADCAGLQGQFWPMHDLLFADLTKLDDANLEERASRLNLDMTGWRACRAGESQQRVTAERDAATKLGIDKTPFFLVGTREGSTVRVSTNMSGARAIDVFTQALDDALRLASTR